MEENINNGNEWVVVKTKKPNKKKKLCIFIYVSLFVVVFTVTALLVVFVFRKNYYESDEFLQMSAKGQLITILHREGDNMINGDKDSYGLGKDYISDGWHYEFILSYYYPEDSLSFEWIQTQSNKRIATQIFFSNDNGTLTHEVWLEVRQGQNINALGKVELYAPTYYNERLYFVEYVGSANKSDAEVMLSGNLPVLLQTMKDMVSKYNFDMKNLAFSRY